MACSCPILYGSTTSADSTPLELGPVYGDYKSGNVSVARSWEGDLAMPTFILDPCCYSVEADINVFLPEVNYILLAWWLFISSMSLLVVFAFPNKQPIRYRRLTDYVWMVLSATVQYIIIVVVFTSDGTGSCLAFVVAAEILFPIHLLYYFIKSSQLAFIYRWSQAKASGDKSRMQWFFGHLYLLQPNAFPIISSIWLVIGIIAVAVQYTSVPMFEFATGERDTFYSAIRCSWWDIPQQYQQEKTTAPACDCIQYAFGIYDDSGDYETLQASCLTTALLPTLSLCLNSSAILDPSIIEDDLFVIGFTTDVCGECVFPLLSAGASIGDGLQLAEIPESCKQYLGAMFSSGNCGYPKQMPDLSTCRGCLPSHKPSFFVISALYYTLVVVNGLAAIYLFVSKVDDRLEVRTENVIASIIGTAPAITVVLVGLSDDKANDEFDRISPDFPLPIIAYHVAYQVYLAVSVFYPAYLVVYWEVLACIQSAIMEMKGEHKVEGESLYSAYSVSDVWNCESIPFWMKMFYVLSPANSYFKEMYLTATCFFKCGEKDSATHQTLFLAVNNSRILSNTISGSVVNASTFMEDSDDRQKKRNSGESSQREGSSYRSSRRYVSPLREFGVQTVMGKGLEVRYSSSDNIMAQFDESNRPSTARMFRSVKKGLGFQVANDPTLSDKIQYGDSCKMFELEFALQNERVGNEFKAFALKEFTIENFQFLKEMTVFADDSEAKKFDIEGLLHKSVLIFEMYIMVGAEFQVNVAASARDRIRRILRSMLEEQSMELVASVAAENPAARKATKYLGEWFGKADVNKAKMEEVPQIPSTTSTMPSTVTTLVIPRRAKVADLSSSSESVMEVEMSEPNSMFPEPGSPSKQQASTRGAKMIRQSVIEMLSPAVREVHKLVLQDSWPRFQTSKEYSSFIKVLEEERGFMNVASTVEETKN